MLLFKKLGRSCCICGLNGVFFTINKGQSKYRKKPMRLTFWGIDNRNRKIKMTIDHVLPQTRYTELKNNFCIICAECNNHKMELPIIEFMKSDYVLKIKEKNFIYL